ncbi:hypothetical protein EV183_005632 [Coemansia sp. RSA 2336]|nr:hypothetical protein EV183_005632 [Coemansia sp. RSA 2336]
MSCSIAATSRASRTEEEQKEQRGIEPQKPQFDQLSPEERERSLAEIEIDFRRYIAENRSKTGFVIYPNSRQITRAISTLYQTLDGIDFSDIL